MDDMKKLELRLTKARTSLVLEHPFIGMIALNMPQHLDDTISPPTAATNGKRVLYHPDFVRSLTDEELKFLVAHECFHPMLDHPFRRNGRDPQLWNEAGDYVINQILTDDKIGTMPASGLLDPALYNQCGGSTDAIYDVLASRPKQDGGKSDGRGALDNCEDGEGSPAELAQQEAEWKVMVAQAANAAKMMGKMSEGCARLVGEILNPKVDWRDVLSRFVTRCRVSTRTFARPNRRFVQQGIYLPTSSGEQLGELCFAIDCSGSISDADVSQFAAEITKVQTDLNPEKIHILYFDSEVTHYDKFERGEPVTVSPHGGGGTDFAPVFEFMREHSIEPVATVFLTDLCCSSYGTPPDCPVLWVTNYHTYNTPPFGEVTEM